MRKFFSLLLIVGLFLSSVPKLGPGVKADGMITPPDYYPVYETQQKALIVYKDNHEDLVISISFTGRSTDFGWVIPLPNQPEISKVDASTFRSLQDITLPKDSLLDKLRGKETDGYYFGGIDAAPSSEGTNKDSTVTVIEEQSIGIFDYAILKAEEPNDLRDWMNEHNYNLPVANTDSPVVFQGSGSQDQAWSDALPIIQDYIDSDWYFVTVKVSNKFAGSTGVETQLEQGALDPLRFSFESSDMIYPMKLTSLAQKSVNVLLYVIADHKVEVSNYDEDYCGSGSECSYFDTVYAGKVTKDQINDLTKEIGKGSWYSADKNMTITKLRAAYLPYTAMTEEVLFNNAKSNEGVNDGTMSIGEWILLPFVFITMIPYLLLGGFVEIFDGNNYYSGEWSTAWFLVSISIFFVLSISCIILTTISLKKTTRRGKRILLYLFQVPSLWFVSLALSSFVAIPIGLLSYVISQNEGVSVINGLLTFSFTTVLLPILFYRRLWRNGKLHTNGKQ